MASKGTIKSPKRKETTRDATVSKRRTRPREDDDDDDDDDEPVQPARTRARQSELAFADGQLTTKAPLMNPISRSDPRRRGLASVAEETLTLLPGLLATRPDVSSEGYVYEKALAAQIDPKYCPKLPGTKVIVVNSDTIDAALGVKSRPDAARPICVLNNANAQHPGGGFKSGAMAQEEALCFRSSLYFTLRSRLYPIPQEGALYSPTVLVFRNIDHTLMDLRTPADLPLISVVSAAAVCQPRKIRKADGFLTYASASDRTMMEQKMRVILRTAIRNHHRRIVLGGFGCGVFGNPPEEVASMWASILKEPEFSGGWWDKVVFAVLDRGKLENFTAFKNALDGLVV